MFKPKLAARAAHAVGNYALQIDFNDGHTTGIYSFDYLRTICPCEDCAREFRTAPGLILPIDRTNSPHSRHGIRKRANIKSLHNIYFSYGIDTYRSKARIFRAL